MPSTDWVMLRLSRCDLPSGEGYSNCRGTCRARRSLWPPMAGRSAALWSGRTGNAWPQAMKARKDGHALRAEDLQLSARPAAGAAQAVRDRDARDLGEARHQAGRLLDGADRREQQRSLLLPGLGLPGRAREEVDGLHDRSGLALDAGR